jgi:hypothetical protein
MLLKKYCYYDSYILNKFDVLQNLDKIMKKLLSLLLVALPALGFCQDMTGNWKEVSRTPNGGRAADFKDTIKIEFLMGNEYVWQKKGGFIYKGTYKIENNKLDMGARVFSLISRDNNSIKMKDEAATYELVRYTPTSEQTVLPPEMKGHWSVFKGTQDKTTPAIDYKRKIKMIDITGDIAGDGKLGMVFSTKDADTAPSWYIESYSNQTLYVNGKDKRYLKVLKCENNELVIEEGGMTYFFRQFK